MEDKEKKDKSLPKPGLKQETRDKKGRFIKGVSGNPKGGNGRPEGSISITAAIKKKLQEIPQGQRKTFLEFLIEQIMKGALRGDEKVIKHIWNYVDGLPQQKVDVTSKGKQIYGWISDYPTREDYKEEIKT